MPELGELLTVAAEQTGTSSRPAMTVVDDLWPDRAGAALERGRVWERPHGVRLRLRPASAETGDWLQASLRRVAASRVAELVCEDLCRRESVWLATLGDHYGSLRHRYAPRTARGSRGLAELLATARPAGKRLPAAWMWVAAGAHPHKLADELEAAVVHARTPSRLA